MSPNRRIPPPRGGMGLIIRLAPPVLALLVACGGGDPCAARGSGGSCRAFTSAGGAGSGSGTAGSGIGGSGTAGSATGGSGTAGSATGGSGHRRLGYWRLRRCCSPWRSISRGTSREPMIPRSSRPGGLYYVLLDRHGAPGAHLGGPPPVGRPAGRSSPPIRPGSRPGAVTNVTALWAPDISYFNGLYHLYYAASTFGSNDSCIGHATKTDLASAQAWADRGSVICSSAQDDFNAIDPNLVLDGAGAPLARIRQLLERDQDRGAHQRRGAGQRQAHLARLAAEPEQRDRGRVPGEARRRLLSLRLVRLLLHGREQHVQDHGRVAPRTLLGPYVDEGGVAMLSGGGSPVLTSGARWRGPRGQRSAR